MAPGCGKKGLAKSRVDHLLALAMLEGGRWEDLRKVKLIADVVLQQRVLGVRKKTAHLIFSM